MQCLQPGDVARNRRGRIVATGTPEQVAACVDEVGVGFMFAPGHHSAMKHAIGPRKEMAARTVFNVLGPLTNPAGVPNLVLTPHVAGITVESNTRVSAMTADQVHDALDGE